MDTYLKEIKRNNSKLVIGFGVLSVLSCAYFFYLERASANWILAYVGYYFCLLAVSAFVVATCSLVRTQVVRIEWKETLKQHAPGLIVCTIVSLLCLIHEKSQMRVFYDEPSHVFQSLRMHLDRMATNAGSAHYQFGELIYLDQSPGFRAYMFSFLVSVIHDLSGYRIGNAFILNGLLGVAINFVNYSFAAVHFSRRSATLGIALFGLLPLFAVPVNSAGYDVVNLFFMTLFFWGGLAYAKSGGSAWLNFWIASAVVFALSRNESVLYLSLIPAVVLLRFVVTKRLELTLWSVVSPLFLLLSLCWKINADTNAKLIPAQVQELGHGYFEWVYLGRHLPLVSEWLFSLDYRSANSPILSFVGCAAILFLVVRSIKGALAKDWKCMTAQYWWVLAFVLFNAGVFLLMLSHYWKTTDSQAIRLILPFHYALLIGSFWFFNELKLSRRGYLAIGMTIALLSIGIVMPKLAASHLTYSSMISRYHQYFEDYIEKHDDGKTLYVSQSAVGTLIHQVPSTSITGVNLEPTKLMKVVKSGLYESVIFFEVLGNEASSLELKGPDPSVPISKEIAADVIEDRRYFYNFLGRISRFKGLYGEDGEMTLIEDYPYERPLFETESEYLGYMGSILP